MQTTRKYLDELTYQILGCAMEVHKQLGPGLLESVYEKCFVRELYLKGLCYVSQQSVPIHYKGLKLDAELRFDVIVEDMIIVELKAIDGLLPIHESILLSYMKLLGKPKGILINFNCINIFKTGQKTLVNEYYSILPK
jgi:GxxExxY protein